MSPNGSGATSAGFAMGPLFTISSPTPCFFPQLPPHLGPSLWGCAVAAPSLGQWKIFMTFCLFSGCLAAGRGRALRTNMSMDKQWSRHRGPELPAPGASRARPHRAGCPRTHWDPGATSQAWQPAAVATGTQIFWLCSEKQQHFKNNPPSQVTRRQHVMLWCTNKSVGTVLGTRQSSRDSTQGQAAICG